MTAFKEAREKFMRAIGGVEAFKPDVCLRGRDELDAIIGDLIAWFDKYYPRKEQPEAPVCARCGDPIPDGGRPSELYDGRICYACAAKE